MKQYLFNPRTLAIAAFILLVAVLRVVFTTGENVSAMVNFTPIGAMALFGGAYFSKGKAFMFPLLTLWISDVFLNKMLYYGEWKLFYDGFVWTYAAFVLMALVGHYMMKSKNVSNFLLSTLSIVLVHWFITDIGVWLKGTTYPTTFEGWVACMVAAIPYEINFMIGTLVYGSLMFGSFEYMKKKIPALQAVPQPIH